MVRHLNYQSLDIRQQRQTAMTELIGSQGGGTEAMAQSQGLLTTVGFLAVGIKSRLKSIKDS